MLNGQAVLASRPVSQSGSQAAAFFTEVARDGVVWYVTGESGSPAPEGDSGERALPYWSSQARAQRAVDIWGGGLRVVSTSLATWRSKHLPELADDGYRIGVNWTGSRLVGWDFEVAEVINRLDSVLCTGPYSDDSGTSS
ncbi:DUF2750 domain-containing protein [Paractinoplanes hotanensis]|uniref:DUF2750 domain-containing protein n=1 Tax=Paractinoplanes hotanensis TaxID=2906497 RepID=A0ABT0YF33_9ACTN|nr:DUF2750 domain-containing protein [Actinoplanes hotanensis]MCM4084644.1 DUF2750 domain-containing protein [Actinoplanes hotanensis]